ncbi:ras and Rab interactor 3 [Trichomycterus rosablanca]|uniref:ras and Rab interactor 3 n=1 Tax=Trichomycterus rosablanca TaxID=2290929 RepID=UPI002F3567F6
MMSSATATAPAAIPKPSNVSPPRSSCPSSPPLLVDISVASTSPNLPSSPPYSTRKTPSSPPPPLISKPSVSSLQRPISPHVPKPICPPLPAQQPSAIPKMSSTAMSSPRAPPRPSSPPLPRPPPPQIVKPPILPAPADQTQKPVNPDISILEKLIKTCPVWLQLGIMGERAKSILSSESPGIFLVRREIGQKLMVMSVRLPDQQGEPQVQEWHVKEEGSLQYLDGSVLVFDNIFKLVAFYCVSRDILPFTLKLPLSIVRTSKYEDMEVISTLGLEFWSSTLNNNNQDDGEQPADHSSNKHLWYINPTFIEEYYNSLPTTTSTPILRSQSLNVPVQAPPKYKRPPPLPPRPQIVSEDVLVQVSDKEEKEELTSDESSLLLLSFAPPVPKKEEGSRRVYAERETTLEAVTVKPEVVHPCLNKPAKNASGGPSHRIPPVPLRRRISDNQPSRGEIKLESSKQLICVDPVETLFLDDTSMAQLERPVNPQEHQKSPPEEGLTDRPKTPNGIPIASTSPAGMKKPGVPVPPPRRKRFTQNTSKASGASQKLGFTVQQVNADNPKVLDVSLFAPEGGVPQVDHDSYSTSSTEEEADAISKSAAVKRTSTIMLDRAKQRLSIMNFSTVFTNFMSADCKLQRKIVELARDGSTYFGNLVKDYRGYTLDAMKRHSSSTEMLQEIRQMMTQLKSYLIQSTELQNLQEPATYSEEKLEIIVEAAICKSVLKPLREPVYNVLKDIHSRAGTMKRLKENQQTVLGTTTTDLGVTTCVPDSHVMDKIQVKLGSLHQEYSPQKKIDLLLKTCKIIYESMSVGCPGKAHGADDFLPVLMYVMARCNMTALLLDVEYMMELMDPVLQLGEGSYYLTTTYGALEHIKNYNKQAATKQLSLEIQDSIHRWERRRTLNKECASNSSVQDFISVSFLEACSNTKTLGVHPNTTSWELSVQCAEKFEVADPASYCLSVLVDGTYRALTPEELPLVIKSELHNGEPRKEYYFVYRHGLWPEEKPGEGMQQSPEDTPALEDSLI